MTRARLKEVTKFSKPDWPTDGDGIIQRIGSGFWANISDYKDFKYDEFHPRVMQYAVRGGYHYLRSGQPWKNQADQMLEVAKDDFHFFICDVEEIGNTMSRTFISMAAEWMQYVKDQTGKKVLIYTNRGIYQYYVTPYEPVKIGQFGFHYASPTEGLLIKPNMDTANPTRISDTGRINWDLWQYRFGEHESFGTELDVFNGTVDDLRFWANVDATPPDPDPIPPVRIPKLRIVINDDFSTTSEKL